MLQGKMVSPRQRAKTQAPKNLTAAWQGIPWTKVHRHVFRLQKRMYQATQRGNVRTVRNLQNRLSKSWYARLLAVRRVPQDNTGKHTAGIDGVQSLKPPARFQLAHELNLDGTATPLRRMWIPKRDTSEKRPLGIPTLHARARQTLVRQVLEPEWEAKLSAHFYGFRPGRSCWDAIAAVFQRIKFRPQHLLKVDISKCFDRLDHWALLAKLQAPSGICRQVRAWLRSGIMEADTLSPTTAGTPQGGSISPLLALVALHGIEEAITQVYPEARLIAYADDCLVLHPERAVLDHCQQLLIEWLAGIGLTLNTSNTRISHTLEGDQPGGAFLGVAIRQDRVGKHQSGKGARGMKRLGYKTLINPAKANVQDHLAELGEISRRGQDWPQAALIRQLNPKIRGWANYYRTWVCQATFSRLAHLTWVKLRHWANRRHPHASLTWMHNRYWRRRDARSVVATPMTANGQVWLTSHNESPSMFHAKVAGNRSPYDGDWVYGSLRQGRYPTVKTRVATLLKRQKGRCPYCGQYFQHDDQLEVDHINGDRRNSRYDNLQALHGHCHDAKTREQEEYLPVGQRAQHQHTEERREPKGSCAVLKQR
jgi:RNA-directed DNA polymerase